MRRIAWIMVAIGFGTPLQAQDLGGALDLPTLGRDLSYSAAMKAQADRRRRGSTGGLAARSIRTCRNARRMGRPTGPKARTYDRLLQLCRQHGY